MDERRKYGDKSPWSLLREDLKIAVSRGDEFLRHQARVGKVQLELAQVKRDRRTLFERLGKEAYQLLLDGRIEVQVELARPFEVLQELDERIRGLEEEIGQI